MSDLDCFNRRVLVVDDNPSIHDDFRKLLGGDEAHDSGFDDEAAALVGAVPSETCRVRFELDSALQGEEALAKVEEGMRLGKPHAMAFVDMRMPPGWDGLETIRRLWKVHPDLEVAICTAYSDRSWAEIQRTLGVTDRLLILNKPFDRVEVHQMALALTEKWNLRRATRLQLETLEEAVRARTSELEAEQRNLRLIQVIAEAANVAPGAREAIRVALESVCGHTGWPVGHAYLRPNNEAEELISTGLWHRSQAVADSQFCLESERMRCTRDTGLPGRVLRCAKAVWMEDATTEPSFLRAEGARAIGLKAAMAFPLLVGTKVVGVLEFFAGHVQPPDERMMEVMSHAGAQLGRVVEREWAQERLEHSEAYFRSLTDNALDLITLLRPDGVVLYESRSVLTLLGYASEEYRGKNLFDLVHPQDAPALRQALDTMEAGANTPQLVFRLKHKDQSFRLMEGMGQNLIADPAVGGIIFNARDVTERKNLEEQFLQAQKVQAIGQLAGGIAHDFNNILTAILGYADLLLMQLPEAGGLGLNALEIKRAAERAACLTRQLLAFSRRQVLQPRVLNVNGVVADMDRMLRRLLGEHLDLVTVTAADLGRVKADGGQIEQVLMNLAVNSRDAMASQGKLTIETRNVTLDAAYCRQRPDVLPGEYVLLAVTDDGCGMSPETAAHMFEPFFTTKGLGQGTGLGLATCHGIVKQSGGHIAVYSEVGRGTSFKIYLPRVYEALDTVARRDGPAILKEGSETVLLVEDEPMLRELGLLVLSGLGYRVLPADNGKQALRILEQHTGQAIHLLVTDVVMPEMGGRELADRLRTMSPRTKVLFCSGYTEDSLFHDGSLGRDIFFLQKPYTISTLANRVRATLDVAVN